MRRRGSWRLVVSSIALAAIASAVLLAATVGQAALPPQARVSFHSETGKVRFIGADRDRPIERPPGIDAGAPPETAARAFLSVEGSQFGLENQARDLETTDVQTVSDGRAVVRFQQVHKGVPILGGELVVQLDEQGNTLAATGEILPDLDLDVVPAIPSSTARQRAIGSVARAHGVAAGGLTASSPELWIYDSRLLGGPGLRRPTLVWRIEVTPQRLGPIRELVLVDAEAGVVALEFNQVHTAKNRQTHNANNTTTLPGTLVCSEASPFPACASGDQHIIGAHKHAGDTYDFYSTRHGRDSFDGAGGALISTVHYGTNYVNAFWNGTQMVYGDGATFAQADDVVGHELTHGVTDRESRLFYYYQSGAINESFSDVWGEFVDLTNGTGNDTAGVRWQMGEDVSPLGAIRNMKDPTLFNDPDRMTSPFYTADPNETDGGGVHSNSGVNNKAAYLMVDGDTFNGKTITGIGIDKTADIYYEVQTNLLTSAGDYQDLYDLLQQACTTLVGTGGITAADCQEVKDAVDAVEMNVAPPAAATVDAPVCPTGQSPSNLFFDDLENTGSGNWASSQIVNANRWFYPPNPNSVGIDATYATSGVMNFWGYDHNNIADYAMARTASIALPAGTSYVHFKHAYGFDDDPFGTYDGGVVEYSINGGASWNDAGSLFTHGGYNGTIDSGFGNPLGGRQAFVRESNGYGSSRLDLSSLAGQSVRIRFRIGTDNIIDDYGWFVDDVRIYTCASVVTHHPFADYDADGDSDFAVYRPSERMWYIRGVPPFVQWGEAGDIPVPGDYDGNGSTEIAVYSPDNGMWYVRGQTPAQWQQWGAPGSADIPVPADYDGNGSTDVAVYRPSTATFWVKNQFTLQIGQVGDVPVPGNYDADPAVEPAVYRPSTRVWVIQGQADVQWGNVGDVPAPGDYNGDGQTDITTYSPADGYWWPKDQPPYVKWGGIANDVPVPGNYNGDASDIDERTIYRRAAGFENGVWYVHGAPSLWAQWGGQAGDVVLNVPPALWLQYYD